MVVAHPDDESLWCLGLVLDCPGQWDIICVTVPEQDPPREGQFWKAMEVIGATGRMLRVPDRGAREPINFILPNLRSYELVLTHNPIGEYGHMHHKQVYAEVRIQRHDLVSFGWGVRDPDVQLTLSPEKLARKQAALRCYGDWYERLVKAYFKNNDANLARESYVDSGLRL